MLRSYSKRIATSRRTARYISSAQVTAMKRRQWYDCPWMSASKPVRRLLAPGKLYSTSEESEDAHRFGSDSCLDPLVVARRARTRSCSRSSTEQSAYGHGSGRYCV